MKKRIAKKQYVNEMQSYWKEYRRESYLIGTTWSARWRRILWLESGQKSHGTILAELSEYYYHDERNKARRV